MISEEVEKSTVPVRHGVPNPMYGRALDLLRQLPQFRELACRVRQQAALLGPDFKFSELRNNCTEVGVRAHLQALVDANRGVPEVAPVMGAPPQTLVLYGSFGTGVRVTDVGSGNCMKLARYTGVVKFTCVDPNVRNDTKQVLRMVKQPLIDAMGQFGPETIFSSWMSVGQLSNQEVGILLSHDGLHMFPDHQYLEDAGIAKMVDDKLKVRTLRGDYMDTPVYVPGYAPAPGYLLTATYRERQISVSLDPVFEEGYVPRFDAVPAGFNDLNFLDLSPKFDGFAVELEACEGKVCLNNREGRQLVGTCDVDFHFCVHMEKMRGCYILFRVVQYRGFVPPHCGPLLRKFAETVKIQIDGDPVLGPPPWLGEHIWDGYRLTWRRGDHDFVYCAPVDGLISRSLGHDLYCKRMWTVDVFEHDFDTIVEKLHELGFRAQVMGLWFEGLNEVDLIREGAKVTFRPRKRRTDKLRHTPVETVLYLVDKPTIGETTVLGGTILTGLSV